MTRTCQHCGADISHKRADAKFCSRKCKAAARRAANPEKTRERDRAWRAANAEKVLEQQRARYAANPEKVLEQQRARYAANPEKVRQYSTRRRNNKRAADPMQQALKATAEIPALLKSKKGESE